MSQLHNDISTHLVRDVGRVLGDEKITDLYPETWRRYAQQVQEQGDGWAGAVRAFRDAGEAIENACAFIDGSLPDDVESTVDSAPQDPQPWYNAADELESQLDDVQHKADSLKNLSDAIATAVDAINELEAAYDDATSNF